MVDPWRILCGQTRPGPRPLAWGGEGPVLQLGKGPPLLPGPQGTARRSPHSKVANLTILHSLGLLAHLCHYLAFSL